jgi:modulator of FtsH protease
MPTYEELGFGAGATVTRDRTRAVFGQVMGLVAFTCGFAALGAYLARDMAGHSWFLFFIGAMACVFGLNFATRAGREQLAIGLLFGMGLLLGMAMSQVIVYYAKTNPSAVYQATVATAGFVGGLGAIGYATRRDLSHWARALFWSLLALIAFGVISLIVAIPHSNVIYCILGLVIFGGFTIFDFNRLRRTSDMRSAVPIAASIFLDIFNVFLFMLSLFGGGGRR